MQPVQDGFLLQHTSELGAFRTRCAICRAQLSISLDESPAYHEDIADFNVATLGFGPDVHALFFRAGLQVCKADSVRCVRVVFNPVLVCIVSVVEQDGPAGDSMRRPVVNTAAEVGVGPVDVTWFGVVVESTRGDMCELSLVSSLSACLSVWLLIEHT